MKEEQAHGTSSTVNAGEQRMTATEKESNAIFKAISRQLNAVVTRPAVQVLHNWELTTTTALALGLMCFWPASAAELELKPTFDNSGVKVAAITFLPDWFGDGNTGEIDIDVNIDSKWCEEKGYTLSCPNQQSVYETCERDTNYIKCNKSTWCKDNGFTISSCSLPKYLDKQCPNGERLYKECVENKPQACKDIGYVNTCPSGQKLYNTTNRCSWDNSFGKCCTPSGCPANTSTSGTYGDSGSKDSCGYACKYTCNMSCPSGTTESNPSGCGGSTTNACGTKTCYNPYKACCTPTCTDYTGSCSHGTRQISNGCSGFCTICAVQIGDIYYTDGTISPDVINGKTALGVVFATDGNSGSAVELVNNSRTIWSSRMIATGATSLTDGKTNTNLMKEYSSPAANTCLNKGMYVPALNQIMAFYNNSSKIYSTFSKIGGSRLSSSDCYVTSSECSAYNSYRFCYLVDGYGRNQCYSKNDTMYDAGDLLRCVFDF